MAKCVVCETTISIANNSDEHIIPHAIGGRRTVSRFICRQCNSKSGHSWDAELASQLLPLSHLIGVDRQSGFIPPLKVRTSADEKVTIRHDGLSLTDPSVTPMPAPGGGTSYRIHARSLDEARRILRGLQRKHPELDVAEEMANAKNRREYLQGAVQHQLEFGGELGGRSIVKTCLAMACASGVASQDCVVATAYLRRAAAPACFGYYQTHDLVNGRVPGTPLHCVAVHADPHRRSILAYAEYFGIHRVVACLGENYDGPKIEAAYAIDPRTGEQLDLAVALNFERSEIEAIYAYEHVSQEAAVQIANAIVGPAVRAKADKERERVLTEAVTRAFETCGAEPGEILTEEHVRRISRSIAESVTPYVLHRLRPRRL